MVDCTADAGTLTINQNPVQLVGGTATVSATPDGNINVPGGYSSIFVLTSGSGLVIEQVNTLPSFSVNATGDYTIHTLVYNADPNDPNFLDLSVVQPGITTGVDVLNLINANGLCASLDVAGAPVQVGCFADAGTITVNSSNGEFCQGPLGATIVSATPDGNAVVPPGFNTLYILTYGPGLTVVGTSPTPSFSTATLGDYIIHTLIYDPNPLSPNYLELSNLVIGSSPATDILQAISAGGLCAD